MRFGKVRVPAHKHHSGTVRDGRRKRIEQPGKLGIEVGIGRLT